MKKLAILVCVLLLVSETMAQVIKRECSSKMRKTARKIDEARVQQRLRTLSVTATRPYMMKLFIVVFSNGDGTGQAAPEADILRQVNNMAGFYSPHDICFSIGGIRYVNNTDLNSMDIDEEEGELEPYIEEGFITVFVHDILYNDEGDLNGYAYDIPNSYLSIVGTAVTDSSNISTLAHEMGHCFGLYHTFEDAFGEENVARSGDCKDCEDDGDYLCDTQADREPVSGTFISNNCTYTGARQDDCGNTLLMELQNIMTYGRRSCRSRFSGGQGNRARSYIVSESYLTDAIAGDDVSVFLSFTYNSGFKSYLAKNSVSFEASSYLTTGSAKVVASAQSVTVTAGTTFSPTSTSGYTVLSVNPYCR